MNLDQTVGELAMVPGCCLLPEAAEAAEAELVPVDVGPSDARQDTVWSMMASAWTPLGLFGTSSQDIAEEVFYRVLAVGAVIWAVYGLLVAFPSFGG